LKMEESKSTLTQDISNIIPKNNLSVETTAIHEYLEICIHEYDNESRIKESFENRAGILFALLSALCVFSLEKMSLVKLIGLINTVPLTWKIVFQVIVGAGAYCSIIASFVHMFIMIKPVNQRIFDIESISNSNLEEAKYVGIVRLIGAYQNCVSQRIILNEKRGRHFRRAMVTAVISLILIVVYSAF